MTLDSIAYMFFGVMLVFLRLLTAIMLFIFVMSVLNPDMLVTLVEYYLLST